MFVIYGSLKSFKMSGAIRRKTEGEIEKCQFQSSPLRNEKFILNIEVPEARNSSGSNNIYCRKLILRIIVLLMAFTNGALAYSVTKNECDPTDKNSCGFGSTCTREYGRRSGGLMKESYYRCKCPQVDCYRAGLYDPVCGQDERFTRSYFNVLCLMLEECELQKPIRLVCSGMCETATCEESKSVPTHFGRCHHEDIGFCLNGGLCVHHKVLRKPFCRCPTGYEGNRCQVKRPPSTDNLGNECDSTSKILTIIAIVLFSLVLLLVVVCLCWRNRRHDGNEVKETTLWISTRSENGQEVKHHACRRSDYLFLKGAEKLNNANR